MQFREAQNSTHASPNDASKEGPAPPEVVEQLRQRLLNNPSDSIETKVAIVGEMTYWCYRQLAKRKFL
jgi:hypothetical protein